MREKKGNYVQPRIIVHKIEMEEILTVSGTTNEVKNNIKNNDEPKLVQQTKIVEQPVQNSRSSFPSLNMPFVFKAISFEEYCSGICTNRGKIDLTITATITDDAINFKLNGILPKGIQGDFSIMLMNSIVMEDRIQYGNLPYNMNDYYSDYPKVCNMFKSDSITINVPPVSLTNVPPVSLTNVPLVSLTNVPVIRR